MGWHVLSFPTPPSEKADGQLWALAAFYSAHAKRIEIEAAYRSLRLAAELDQLMVDVDDGEVKGFVAWLRADDPEAMASRDEDTIRALGSQLSAGPHLFITEILAIKRGFAYKAARALGRLPGVESIGGLHEGTRRETGRWARASVRVQA